MDRPPAEGLCARAGSAAVPMRADPVDNRRRAPGCLRLSTGVSASVSSASNRAPSVPGYRTRQILGVGSSGEVWSAVEISSGKSVALKLVSVREDDRARVRRECLTARRIDHAHVLRLRSVVEVGPDVLALVLDYAPGGSLAGLVAARGALEPGEVVTVLTPLATALADLHERGLVHGDVSPGNILFAEDGRPLPGQHPVR